MARRSYRESFRGQARHQNDDQLQDSVNELRALAEVIVDMYLAESQIVGAVNLAAEPSSSTSRDEEIEDYAETLAFGGIPLAEARRLARINQSLVEGTSHG